MKPCKRAAITMKMRGFMCFFSAACKLSYGCRWCYVVCIYCAFLRGCSDTYINCFAIIPWHHRRLQNLKTANETNRSFLFVCLSARKFMCAQKIKTCTHFNWLSLCLFCFISVLMCSLLLLMFGFCTFHNSFPMSFLIACMRFGWICFVFVYSCAVLSFVYYQILLLL